ncbi:MAG TPA: hypothetical protein ENJ75_02680 [Candidatus Kaiserbacteria bacterium]|nr:hypothetical protein [Candidatus Kaiserbacteria bacterium]
MKEPRTIIIYHKNCPDGFGAAYSAWKKFGNDVEYLPSKPGVPPTEDFSGADLYFIDVCYPKDTMDKFAQTASSITVLDHHEGMRDVATSFPGVFDSAKSGATIAWSYFHPDTPVPLFLRYVENGDLYTFSLPDARAVLSYAYLKPFTFESWETIIKDVENPSTLASYIEKGKIYAEHSALLVENVADHADLVSFEGYECYLASVQNGFASDVGNILAKRKPPLAIALSMTPEVLHVSLRSIKGADSVDVAKIAQKYGGNGHPNASGFRIAWGDTLPWTPIKDEDTGN